MLLRYCGLSVIHWQACRFASIGVQDCRRAMMYKATRSRQVNPTLLAPLLDLHLLFY
jgi:hypothetical protein